MEGHFNISITKRVSLENSTDLGRGAAPELKSVEFLSETLLVVEQIDIHTNFTARQMLYLYRSITHRGCPISFYFLFWALWAPYYWILLVPATDARRGYAHGHAAAAARLGWGAYSRR